MGATTAKTKRATTCGKPWWRRHVAVIGLSYQKHMGYCKKPKGHRGECGETK